jgi:hypothetical protein
VNEVEQAAKIKAAMIKKIIAGRFIGRFA